MSDIENKTIEAIGKILSLTREGKINWVAGDRHLITGEKGDIIPINFIGEYLGKKLRIYEKKYIKQIVKPSVNSLFYGLNFKEPEYINQNFTDTILEIVDDNGNSLWSFPDEDIIRDLLKAVKYKASGAQEFIDKILEN